MLKQLLLWMAVCVSGLLSAQKVVTVECKVAADLRMNKDNEVKLYKVENGEMVEKAAGSYAGEGYFGFRFIPEYEGFYVVGEKMNYYYPVWVKGGEDVSVLIDRNGARLEGEKNSRENEVLYQWIALAQPVCNQATRSFLSKGVTFPEFFQKLEEFIPLTNRFKAEIRTKNPYFDEMMARYVDFSRDFYAMSYLSLPKPTGYTWPQVADYSPYYSTILSPDKFRDNVVLRVPEGFRLLGQYVGFASRMGGESKKERNLDVIPCPELRGLLALDRLKRVNSVFQFRKQADEYRSVFSEEQRKAADEMLRALQEKNARQKTVDFTFPDVNGNMISLSDFKGKVVLVDIWATWCGPCRGELPALKKLEEEMEGTDLVVIGISTDVKKDYAKWKKMVDNGEVKGIQLFADGGKALKEAYNVSGIPRFIVFGRDGKIAEAAAPRPSSPDLKELLNSLLKK